MKARKKWLFVLAGLLVVFLLCIYIFIPGELEVSAIRSVKCNASGAARVVHEGGERAKWWPPTLEYPIPGAVINVFPLGGVDSTILQMRSIVHTGLNPFKRVLQYRNAFRMKSAMSIVLSRLGPFLEKKENIYGMDVQGAMSKDSAVVKTEIVTFSYPDTAEVYRAIRGIRAYIISQKAKETGYPMMHVVKVKDGSFKTMIAVPCDRMLNKTENFLSLRFVPWKILTGEVRGGPYVAEEAMRQLQFYVSDHQKTAMAIPFQALVTERNLEPDTSRWVTRVVQVVP
jgi:hypothetical protein